MICERELTKNRKKKALKWTELYNLDISILKLALKELEIYLMVDDVLV